MQLGFLDIRRNCIKVDAIRGKEFLVDSTLIVAQSQRLQDIDRLRSLVQSTGNMGSGEKRGLRQMRELRKGRKVGALRQTSTWLLLGLDTFLRAGTPGAPTFLQPLIAEGCAGDDLEHIRFMQRSSSCTFSWLSFLRSSSASRSFKSFISRSRRFIIVASDTISFSWGLVFIFLARMAKLRVDCDSSRIEGLMVQMMEVKALPPSDA